MTAAAPTGSDALSAPAPAPAAPAAAPAAVPTAAPTASSDWYPAEAKGYVENKGWKTPADALTSYQNLEKFHNAPADRRLILPEKADDAEGWAKVHERLGRPASAAEYKFEGYEPVTEGFDLMAGPDGFREFAHKQGLSQSAANAAFQWYAAINQKAEAQLKEKQAEKATAEMDSLRSKWGSAYEQNLQTGRAAVTRLGVSGEESLEKIENALGTGWLLEKFATWGRMLGEHERPPANAEESEARFGLTPAQAQSKVNELLRDPEFFAKYREGGMNSAEFKRIQQLTQLAAGTAPAGSQNSLAKM